MPIQHLYSQISAESSAFYAWFDAMHTRIDIVLCNLDEESSNILLDNIVNEIQQVELLSNRFDPQSELGRVNLLAALSPYKISN